MLFLCGLSVGVENMKKGFKTVILFLLAMIFVLSAFGCTGGSSDGKTRAQKDAELIEKMMQEAQNVTDFMRDQKFLYGDARINPGINWEHLDPSKAVDRYEKIVSCDRLVCWILYRCGFTDQPYTQGVTVWYMADWCEKYSFEKIEKVEDLKAGDVVFVNPDSQNRPSHVFLCASARDEYGMYLRYDAGSDQRIQCKKGTEATPGQQPFNEGISGFMYAYRPNTLKVDENYTPGKPNPNATAELSFDIPYGTPKIDGIIDSNEYSSHYTMDKNNCSAWKGSMGNSKTEIYFTWDEEGLYYAGRIYDNTPSYGSAEESWDKVDCLRLSINPANLIDSHSGIFFTFGATNDKKVVAYRNSYTESVVTDKITGASSGHIDGSNSYIIEVKIPWELLKIKKTSGNKVIDTTSFKPENNVTLGLLPCVVDHDSKSGVTISAYRHNDTTFNTKYFVPSKLTK